MVSRSTFFEEAAEAEASGGGVGCSRHRRRSRRRAAAADLTKEFSSPTEPKFLGTKLSAKTLWESKAQRKQLRLTSCHPGFESNLRKNKPTISR